MEYYNNIHAHIKNKFNSLDKIEVLDALPNISELENIKDNKLYKCAFASVAVDIVDFKKLSKHSDPKVLNVIMSEFTYGITKIMKQYDAIDIDIQGDGVFCTLRVLNKGEVENAFNLACALNTFQNHINKMISKKFHGKLKKEINSYYQSNFKLEFGIGVWFSFENYISKVGFRKNRELIYMGESVNGANALAKLANRNGNERILMNSLTQSNFTDEMKAAHNKIGGLSRAYNLRVFDKEIYGVNWVINNYNYFIENGV